MAHWKDAAVTNDGVEMLNEWMAGRTIKVVAAYGGAGTVPVEELAEQTGLADPRQKLTLAGEENRADGKTVQVQISNVAVTEEYELSQVGVFALLDPGRETETKPKLLFIMQDEKGVTVPSAMDASFLLELYCMIGITNNGRFLVSIDAAGVVTTAYMRETLERAILNHSADGAAHQDIRDKVDAAAESGVDAEAAVAGIDARLTLLELMYRTQVSGNPFTVTFRDMSGLLVTGVWNAPMNRVEF